MVRRFYQLGFPEFFQGLKITEILMAAGSQFVFLEVFESDEWNKGTREWKHFPARICVREIHPENAYEYINSVRRNTKLAHAFFVKIAFFSDARQRSEKIVKRRNNALGILR